MKSDPGLEATREKRISREHGNDPRRLVEFYMDYQPSRIACAGLLARNATRPYLRKISPEGPTRQALSRGSTLEPTLED